MTATTAELLPALDAAPAAPAAPSPRKAAPRSKSPGSNFDPTPTLRLASKPNSSDVAGFFAGLVLYALFLSYIRQGPAGPKAWLGAKFLNKTSAGSSSSGIGLDTYNARMDSTLRGSLTQLLTGGIHLDAQGNPVYPDPNHNPHTTLAGSPLAAGSLAEQLANTGQQTLTGTLAGGSLAGALAAGGYS